MNTYKILTLNGGGIRGITSARLLQRMNESVPLIDNTDLFAGVSTGGLISLGLAYGLDLESIKNIYLKEGKNIFKDSVCDDLKDMFGLAGADYDIKNLETVLKNLFGNARINDLKKKVFVTAFDLDNENPDINKRSWAPVIFSNLNGNYYGNNPFVYEAGCSTAAAPCYFPSYNGLIDGGLVNTNCSMGALSAILNKEQAIKESKKEEVLLVNVGTGISLKFIEGNKHDYGYWGWFKNIIAAMMDGDDYDADLQCRAFLGDNYLRISPVFPFDVKIEMDAVDKMSYMLEFADKFDIDPALEWLNNKWRNTNA